MESVSPSERKRRGAASHPRTSTIPTGKTLSQPPKHRMSKEQEQEDDRDSEGDNVSITSELANSPLAGDRKKRSPPKKKVKTTNFSTQGVHELPVGYHKIHTRVTVLAKLDNGQVTFRMTPNDPQVDSAYESTVEKHSNVSLDMVLLDKKIFSHCGEGLQEISLAKKQDLITNYVTEKLRADPNGRNVLVVKEGAEEIHIGTYAGDQEYAVPIYAYLTTSAHPAVLFRFHPDECEESLVELKNRGRPKWFEIELSAHIVKDMNGRGIDATEEKAAKDFIKILVKEKTGVELTDTELKSRNFQGANHAATDNFIQVDPDIHLKNRTKVATKVPALHKSKDDLKTFKSRRQTVVSKVETYVPSEAEDFMDAAVASTVPKGKPGPKSKGPSKTKDAPKPRVRKSMTPGVNPIVSDVQDEASTEGTNKAMKATEDTTKTNNNRDEKNNVKAKDITQVDISLSQMIKNLVKQIKPGVEAMEIKALDDEQKILNLQITIGNQEKIIHDLTQNNTAHQTKIGSLDSLLKEAKTAIADRDKHLDTYQTTAGFHRAKLDDKEQQLGFAQAEVTRVKKEIEQLKSRLAINDQETTTAKTSKSDSVTKEMKISRPVESSSSLTQPTALPQSIMIGPQHAQRNFSLFSASDPNSGLYVETRARHIEVTGVAYNDRAVLCPYKHLDVGGELKGEVILNNVSYKKIDGGKHDGKLVQQVGPQSFVQYEGKTYVQWIIRNEEPVGF